MKLGSVFEQTSNVEFVAMLDPEQSGERLLFSYLELNPDGGKPRPDRPRIIARVKSIHKENPLLSRDQAGISASIDTSALPVSYSQRFTYGWAKCSVVGEIMPGGYIDMNKRVVPPNAEVHTPSPDTLQNLFFSTKPSHLPLGTIDTFGDDTIEEVPVTLDGDAMATKHFCVFGMTGTGKTNTAAKIVEEYLSRGHRTIIFDPHDDYSGLDDYVNLFKYIERGQENHLGAPIEYGDIVRQLESEFNVNRNEGLPHQHRDEAALERLLRLASVIYNNTPARNFLTKEDGQPKHDGITPEMIDVIDATPFWKEFIESPGVRGGSMFPELKFYTTGFTINLMEAFRGREFSPAQREWLQGNVRPDDQSLTGLDFLESLEQDVGDELSEARGGRRKMLQVVSGAIDTLKGVYHQALNANARPFDLSQLLATVCHQEHRSSEPICRLSLSDLPSNLRKATVYGVVEYFFQQFKYGNYRVRDSESGPANALPVLFLLEEARSLIPSSSGLEDEDVAGKKARGALRRIAYEGRKFSLGYGLVSQKPSTVDQEVTSQANTFILHQLKSPDDQQYVRKVTESMDEEELDMISSLGTGRALVSGLSVKSPVLLDVFFRYSAEGIESPTPIDDSLGEAVKEARESLDQSTQSETEEDEENGSAESSQDNEHHQTADEALDEEDPSSQKDESS